MSDFGDSNPLKIRIPSKVFLMGEYIALSGHTTLLLTHTPYFELRLKSQDSTGRGLSPGPVQSLLQWFSKEKGLDLSPDGFSFLDPYQNIGGFGGSTAEFISVLKWIESQHLQQDRPRGPMEIWSLYRKLVQSTGDAVLPSGVDLLSQFILDQTGVGVIETRNRHFEALEPGPEFQNLLIYSAAHLENRKVRTHEHLLQLKKNPLTDLEISDLEGIVLEGVRAIKNKNWREFSLCLSRYAEKLSAIGLESEAARMDRMDFFKIPKVLGVKGAGALLADALVVSLSDSSAFDEVHSFALKKGLKLISRGTGI